MSIVRASRIPLSASASRIAAPVLLGRCARGPRRRGAPCISRRRSALRHSRQPEPGMGVRTGGNAINVARESKGRYRKAYGPSACDRPGIGVWRKPTCSTSRSPPPSISTALLHGSTLVRGPRRAPLVSPPLLLPAPYPLGHCLAKTPAALPADVRSWLDRKHISTTKIIYVVSSEKKAPIRLCQNQGCPFYRFVNLMS